MRQVNRSDRLLQPIATTGGADPETLDQADTDPGLLRHQERAVTASDYQSLANEVPGASGARGGAPAVQATDAYHECSGRGFGMVIPGKDGV